MENLIQIILVVFLSLGSISLTINGISYILRRYYSANKRRIDIDDIIYKQERLEEIIKDVKDHSRENRQALEHYQVQIEKAISNVIKKQGIDFKELQNLINSLNSKRSNQVINLTNILMERITKISAEIEDNSSAYVIRFNNLSNKFQELLIATNYVHSRFEETDKRIDSLRDQIKADVIPEPETNLFFDMLRESLIESIEELKSKSNDTKTEKPVHTGTDTLDSNSSNNNVSA